MTSEVRSEYRPPPRKSLLAEELERLSAASLTRLEEIMSMSPKEAAQPEVWINAQMQCIRALWPGRMPKAERKRIVSELRAQVFGQGAAKP
jgi:hypothetical protein